MRYFLIPLFLSSQTQINLKVSNIHSQAFTFMVDNSKTIDHLHRNINIHRAFVFSGLQLIWSADSRPRRRFSDLSNTIFTFFFLTECLMKKQATNQTPMSVNIWLAAAGFQQTLALPPTSGLISGAGFTSPSACQRSWRNCPRLWRTCSCCRTRKSARNKTHVELENWRESRQKQMCERRALVPLNTSLAMVLQASTTPSPFSSRAITGPLTTRGRSENSTAGLTQSQSHSQQNKHTLNEPYLCWSTQQDHPHYSGRLSSHLQGAWRLLLSGSAQNLWRAPLWMKRRHI